MTQEDKELLLKDLSARLPYGVKVNYIFDDGSSCAFILSTKILDETIEKGFKPYLRPMMSNMTWVEENEWHNLTLGQRCIPLDNVEQCIDWLYAHQIDFRGLIPKGLALEAPEGMYRTE